jgi:proton-dependent oligopeptide transporter, POT family
VLWVIAGGLVAVIFLGVVADQVFGLSGDVLGNVFGVGLVIASIVVFVGYFMNVRDSRERNQVIAMIPLFLGSIGFFGVFEQASTTLSIYAEQMVHREWIFGWNVEASFYQFPNGFFIIVFAAPFAALWLWLGRRGKEPTSVTKFGIGMVFAALSFVVLIPTLPAVTERQHAIDLFANMPYVSDLVIDTDYQRVSPNYLILLYLVATLSELCISPVGLSSMSKLAPPRLAGMVMGTWFLATANGNYIAGRAAGITESRGYTFLCFVLITSALVIAAALFVVSPIIKRLMARGTTLPTAKVVDG